MAFDCRPDEVAIVEERNSLITAMVFSFSGLKVGNGSSSGSRSD